MPRQNQRWTYGLSLLALTIFLILAVFVALSLGRYSQDPGGVFQVVLAKMGLATVADGTLDTVVFRIRLPRILTAVMVGAMLSLSGAVYQAIFKNPLVSPDILGVSSGAAVGAALAILLGLGLAGRQVMAFAFGLLAVLMTTSIPKLLKRSGNLMLVLAGIIVGGFLNALLALMKYVAEEDTELASIVYWQMGSLSRAAYADLLSVLPFALVGGSLLLLLSWRINILSFGDQEARTLGMNLGLYRGLIIASASLLTASAVAISGTIGWVGLVIPHLSRLMVGADNVRLLPFAMVLGGTFMLVVDTISRTLSTAEIPLSILTGFIGAPLFLFLLVKQRTRIE